MFSPKLNFRFYLISILLCSFLVLGWYCVFSMSTNVIMTGDGVMTASESNYLIIAISVVLSTWTVSLFSLARQIIIGSAFTMDEKGIHSTLSATILFSLIFVVPIRNIPYSAIERVEKNKDGLILHLKKSELDVFPLFRLFVSKRHTLFHGFTVEKSERIVAEIGRFITL